MDGAFSELKADQKLFNSSQYIVVRNVQLDIEAIGRSQGVIP